MLAHAALERLMNVLKVFAMAVGCGVLPLVAASSGALSKTATAVDVTVAPASSAAYAVANEAVVVSGRSVSAHHKSRMHHVRVKRDDSADAPVAGDLAPQSD
jgi:hypothetical protein